MQESIDTQQDISKINIQKDVKEPLIQVNQEKPQSSFIRLYSYAAKHRWLLIIGNIASAVTSLFMVVLPYYTGQMIDSIAKGNKNSELTDLSIEFGVLILIQSLFSLIRGFCYNLLGEIVILEIRHDVFSNFIQKDIEFFDKNKSGELMSRITSDIAKLQYACSDTISILLRNIVQFIGSFVLLWLISIKLTIVLLVAVLPFVITVRVFFSYNVRLTKKYQDFLAIGNNIAAESLGNIRIVRSFGTEQKEKKQFNHEMVKIYGIGKSKSLLYATFSGSINILAFGAILSVLWYGGSLVYDNQLSIGNLTSFVMYTVTLSVGLISIGGTLNDIMTAVGVAEKLFEMMNIPNVIKDGYIGIEGKLIGKIEFKEVTFSYPSNKEVKVLNNLNMQIKRGQNIALVGASGSGKSSIISLIERFYDINEGEILVDNINIKNYISQQFHQQIGYVSQEPTLFSGTLEQNITYGVESYTNEDIQNAMKMANALDFVNNVSQFPEGLNTVVGERGVKLSGGQKQRIAIARALIKNPKILIFDEATSALDAQSEYQVQQAIDGLVQQGEKTIILIAHRLSTIINCDLIFVLDSNQLVEQGSHKELLELNGIYKKLIERQLQNQTEK